MQRTLQTHYQSVCYTDNMSTALSPFYKSNDLIFISGQVGLDDDDKIPEDFANQAKNTLVNLKKVIESAGSELGKTAKVNVYLVDLSHFAEFNDIYVEFFGGHKPARTTLGVKELPRFEGDPLIHIEIDAIAAQ